MKIVTCDCCPRCCVILAGVPAPGGIWDAICRSCRQQTFSCPSPVQFSAWKIGQGRSGRGNPGAGQEGRWPKESRGHQGTSCPRQGQQLPSALASPLRGMLRKFPSWCWPRGGLALGFPCWVAPAGVLGWALAGAAACPSVFQISPRPVWLRQGFPWKKGVWFPKQDAFPRGRALLPSVGSLREAVKGSGCCVRVGFISNAASHQLVSCKSDPF